jgi:hypothetical protein
METNQKKCFNNHDNGAAAEGTATTMSEISLENCAHNKQKETGTIKAKVRRKKDQ